MSASSPLLAESSHCEHVVLLETENDLEHLVRIVNRQGLTASTILCIALTEAAGVVASDAGFQVDHKLVSTFGEAEAQAVARQVELGLSKLVEDLPGKGLQRMLMVAMLPRIEQILRYCTAVSWIVTEATAKYPNVGWLELPVNWTPYIPVGPKPLNEPARSGIMRALISGRRRSGAGRIIARLNLLHLRVNIKITGQRLKSCINALFSVRPRWLSRAFVQRQPLMDGFVDGAMSKDEASGSIVVLLMSDFARTFRLESFLSHPRNLTVSYLGGDDDQIRCLHNAGAQHLPGVYSDYSNEWKCLVNTVRMLTALRSLGPAVRAMLDSVLPACPAASRSILSGYIMNPQVWDIGLLGRLLSNLEVVFAKRNVETFATSDVDTFDARIALLVAQASGARTVSWSHAYQLQPPSRFRYLADCGVLHGAIEARFVEARSNGSVRTVLAGSSRRRPHVSGGSDNSTVAVISASSPHWATGLSKGLLSTVERTLQIIDKTSRVIVLKLHPCIVYGRAWTDIAERAGASIVQSPWVPSDFEKLCGVVFIGHPGSSLVDVACCQSAPAVVIPLSSSDREIFGEYGFAHEDPRQAVALLERATSDETVRQGMLDELNRFLRDCVEDEKNPEGVLTRALHQPTMGQ